MNRYIAFLRAINVGGHTVKMEHLRTLLGAIDLHNVETFIASGNAIFDSPVEDTRALEKHIEQHLKQALGYEVATFLRTPAQLAAVAGYKPFSADDLAVESNSLYVAFTHTAPAEDAQRKLLAHRTEVDDFHVHGREAYWLCRIRSSDSTFSGARLEKALGMPATMRNVTTVRKLAAHMPLHNPEEYFERLAQLLELEAEAEKLEALREMQSRTPAAAEAAGTSLTGLVIREEDAGLGGRILLTLAKRNQSLPFPWTRLGSGTPVLLSEESAPAAGSGWRGVVTRLYKDGIQVAFAQWPETESERPSFRLDRSSDEISRQRQRQALDKARGAQGSRLAELRDVLLGKSPARFHAEEEITVLNQGLNDSQRQAVRFALSAEDVAILHGPPGTGKTTTIVELIRQIARSGQRVLAVAPSNIAVDNMLERLLAGGEKPVRLGHPARVSPELREHTLDLLMEKHPDARMAHKLAREAYSLRDQAGKHTRARPEPGARKAMRQEAKHMLADARKIEDQVVERLLDSARIVCATTTGLDRDQAGKEAFDWCIIDEASQATEANAWAPLQFAQRLVLAGDHCQLPPTIVSAEAARRGFNVSLMERLITEIGPNISRRLDVQYRMHQAIMEFSSREFYEGSLRADPSVGEHLLHELPGLEAGDLTGTPIHFIDTAGAGYDEAVEADGESRFNPQEAQLALKKLQSLLDAGLAPSGIAIISPYSAQVRLLRERLNRQPEVEVDSVDGFQGREKEAVIVSLVRSNSEGEIGFLEDVRRMNVALTRARRKLIVIGDSATIAAHPFYQRMVAYFESIGAYHSVWEEKGGNDE